MNSFDYLNPNPKLFKGRFEFFPSGKQWEKWPNIYVGIGEGYMAFELEKDSEKYLDTYIRIKEEEAA